MAVSRSNALSILSIYNSNSDSEDDVPGPRVSVKRCIKDDDNNNPNKCFKNSERLKLPVPSILKHVEDCDETKNESYGGRIRTFPHERGNWSTFAYIIYENNDIVNEMIAEIIMQCKHLVLLQPSDNLHVSLTKTVVLRHHWIDAFVSSITEKISHVKWFIVLFDHLEIYCNEERTRTFIGLQIRSGHDSLLNIVNILNKCLEEFNLPTFYTNPSFHMSLVWCVGDYETELTNIIDNLNNVVTKYMTNSDYQWYIHVKNLVCKTGNKYFKFNLSSF